MTLITLQRLAPVAPHATKCRLCDAPIAGKTQDDLLIGQPGTAEVRGVICHRCGDVIVRLVEVCGTNVSVLIKGDQAARRAPVSTEIEETRDRLTREADTLGRSAETLRGEAEKLSQVNRKP
jgi:hypothetical protein